MVITSNLLVFENSFQSKDKTFACIAIERGIGSGVSWMVGIEDGFLSLSSSACMASISAIICDSRSRNANMVPFLSYWQMLFSWYLFLMAAALS